MKPIHYRESCKTSSLKYNQKIWKKRKHVVKLFVLYKFLGLFLRFNNYYYFSRYLIYSWLLNELTPNELTKSNELTVFGRFLGKNRQKRRKSDLTSWQSQTSWQFLTKKSETKVSTRLVTNCSTFCHTKINVTSCY